MIDVNENIMPGFLSNTGGNDAGAKMSQLILDSTPLAVIVLDSNNSIVDCNGVALRLFDAPSKKELLEDFFLYSDPIQPNGMFSGEYARELVMGAIADGERIAGWTHRNRNGDSIPSEVTFKRIGYDGTYLTIVYIRDLRAEIMAQEEVREVTERNKIMIDVTPICFVFFDDSFNIVD